MPTLSFVTGVSQWDVLLRNLARAVQRARRDDYRQRLATLGLGLEGRLSDRIGLLSGGQRQRIAIARAMLKNTPLLLLDEATSALDNETEQAVMQAIECLSRDLTLLIIAHRLTTLKSCTQIVELDEGGIKRIGSYQDIVNQSATNTSLKSEKVKL